MSRKILIISLPLLLDNPIASKLGLHPLKDVDWEYLSGSVYLVRLESHRVPKFLNRLRKCRWLNIGDLFDDLLLFQFDSEEEAQNFLREFLPNGKE